jgi:hypothetical protein
LNCVRAGSNVSVTINRDAIRQVRIEVRRSSLPNRDITAWRTPSWRNKRGYITRENAQTFKNIFT